MKIPKIIEGFEIEEMGTYFSLKADNIPEDLVVSVLKIRNNWYEAESNYYLRNKDDVYSVPPRCGDGETPEQAMYMEITYNLQKKDNYEWVKRQS